MEYLESVSFLCCCFSSEQTFLCKFRTSSRLGFEAFGSSSVVEVCNSVRLSSVIHMHHIALYSILLLVTCAVLGVSICRLGEPGVELSTFQLVGFVLDDCESNNNLLGWKMMPTVMCQEL